MRVGEYDAAVEAALDVARTAGLTLILRVQEATERRLIIVDGRIDRDRTNRVVGLGLHVFTADGSVGFASVDDVRPEAARSAVRRAGALAVAARSFDAARTDAPSVLRSGGQLRLHADHASPHGGEAAWSWSHAAAATVVDAQAALADVHVGTGRSLRTTLHTVDECWRIIRSDGTDVSFGTPRWIVRHELTGRLDGRIVRAAGTVAGQVATDALSDAVLARLATRTRRAALDSVAAAGAPPPKTGSYRLVLNAALAKGLAHEALGHLCESDVDGSVLMQRGRLRLGERLAAETVSVVDGPLPGDFAQQPVSANGILRQTVTLIDRGMLAGGLGDLFSAARAGIPISGAGRISSFRDRPTPRMTNIRIQVAGAHALAVDPDDLAPDDVASALRRSGLLDAGVPTLYLAGYRGGQAHPRRGDFVFGADAAYDLSDGGRPYGSASFTGLAERALAAIVAGIGPLCTDNVGMCNKDGSSVSSSGGSHALLVLDADPDLVISAAT